MSAILKKFIITREVYEKITSELDGEYTPDLSKYKGGFSPKSAIYYNKKEIVCPEHVLNYYAHNIKGCTDWKQCICEVDDNSNKCTTDMNPVYAYNYENKILKKYYTEQEIEDILNSHTLATFEPQIHYIPDQIPNIVYKYTNCYHYDFHKAHASILCELFPRAAKDIVKVAKHNKKVANIYVGYLTKVGHRETYNWVIKQINDRLRALMDKVGGDFIYINTDGFVVQHPVNVVPNSDKIGEAGLDIGDCYFVYGDNYWLIQMNNDMKGLCRNTARENVDLSKGIIAQYNIVDNKATNIKLRKVNIYETC